VGADGWKDEYWLFADVATVSYDPGREVGKSFALAEAGGRIPASRTKYLQIILFYAAARSQTRAGRSS
jgi:hypothetical protein